MMLCETERNNVLTSHILRPNSRSQRRWKTDCGSNLLKKFKIEPGAYVKLGNIDPSYCGNHESHEAALPEMLSQLTQDGSVAEPDVRGKKTFASHCTSGIGRLRQGRRRTAYLDRHEPSGLPGHRI